MVVVTDSVAHDSCRPSKPSFHGSMLCAYDVSTGTHSCGHAMKPTGGFRGLVSHT